MPFNFFTDTWRDNLVSASFRGVPFSVVSSESNFGRKLKVWTPWGNDDPLLQDAGAAPDEFLIEGFIIANAANDYNYFDMRDNLIKALKGSYKTKREYTFTKKSGGKTTKSAAASPGLLSHPFYGDLYVALKEPAKITETFEEGGIARFEMRFIQFGESKFEGATEDYVGAVDESALEAINNALDNAIAVFNAASAFVNSITNDLNSVMSNIIGAMAAVRGAIGSTIAAVTGTVSTLIQTIASIVAFPSDLIATFEQAANAMLGVVGMAGETITGGVAGGYTGTVRGDAVVMDGSSIPENLTISIVRAMAVANDINMDSMRTLAEDEENNRTIIILLQKMLLLCNAARVAMRGEYLSQDKAISTANYLVGLMDDFIIELGSYVNLDVESMMNGMEDLRKSFIEAMYKSAARLKKIVEYTPPPNVKSTLVLAYERFEDIYRDEEIFDMNRPNMDHPGFLPGGNTIEVLSS